MVSAHLASSKFRNVLGVNEEAKEEGWVEGAIAGAGAEGGEEEEEEAAEGEGG